MFPISSMPSATVPTGVVIFGAAMFWCGLVGLFTVAVFVRVAVAAVNEAFPFRKPRPPRGRSGLVVAPGSA